MDFNESLAYLLSLGHETLAIKLGLRNIQLLLNELDNPQQSFASVQIAGTNGKGSTAVMLDSICRSAGLHTGLFTSPHLVSITERIRINGIDISQRDFAQFATSVRQAADALIANHTLPVRPTFFEHVTAIAFLAFKAAEIEIAILETGLGGRLDATTAANASVVGITPIALDHQEYLGETLSQIAAEKAAIIKPGTSAVVAPQAPLAHEVILAQCEICGVTPIEIARPAVETVFSDGHAVVSFQTAEKIYPKLKIGLRGRHQITNAAMAISLAEELRKRGHLIPDAAIVSGIETVEHPGRLELNGRYLLDGAHNPAAAETLRSYLDEFIDGPITLLFGAMRDKCLKEMAQILFPAANNLVLTQPQNIRAAAVDDLRSLAADLAITNVFVTHNVAEGLNVADRVSSAGGIICVTGSLYLLGEVKATLAQTSMA